MIRLMNTMLQKAVLTLAIAIIVLLGGCSNKEYTSGSNSVAPPVKQTTQEALKKSVDDYLAGADSSAPPGTIVALQMNGYQPWYYTSGSAELDLANGGVPKTVMNENMQFRIASVTKMFIAQAIILLEKEGKLSFNDTVEQLLPGALTGINAANAGRITVAMLLNHTSGLYSYVTSDAGLLNGNLPNMNMPMNQFVMDLGQTPWTHSVSPQDKVLTFANNFAPPVQIKVPVFNNISAIGNPYSTNPYFSPGASWHYSNTNYYLLGLIIEKVTGNSVSSELQRLIITPLGLTDTYLPTTKEFQTTNFAHGYTDYFSAPYTTPLATAVLRFNLGGSGWYNGDGILEDFSFIEPSFTWTTGGMVSSVKDLIKFMQYVITERVQSREEVQHWINAAPIDNATSFHYGRGLAKVADSFIGHGGQFAGYNVAAYWISGSDAYLVVMTNKYSYFEGDPNNIGSIIGSMGQELYKTPLAGKVSNSDPNTAIINGLLGVLANEPDFGKTLKKSSGGHLTLPDIYSIMQ